MRENLLSIRIYAIIEKRLFGRWKRVVQLCCLRVWMWYREREREEGGGCETGLITMIFGLLIFLSYYDTDTLNQYYQIREILAALIIEGIVLSAWGVPGITKYDSVRRSHKLDIHMIPTLPNQKKARTTHIQYDNTIANINNVASISIYYAKRELHQPSCATSGSCSQSSSFEQSGQPEFLLQQ